LDLTTMDLLDKLLIGSSTQYLGMLFCIIAATLSITARNGTDSQKSTISLMNAIGCLVQFISCLIGVSYWEPLGVPAAGLYFNAGLFLLIAVLNLLGSTFPPVYNLSADIFRNPMNWGFLLWIVVGFFYAVMAAFATDSLTDGYGVKLEGKSQLILHGSFKYSMAPILLNVILLFKGHMITAGSYATYVVGRFLSAATCALTLMSAIWAMVFTCLNEGGKYDKIISGQYFNMSLWFVFFLLFYVPMARMDHVFAPAIQKKVNDDSYVFDEVDEESDE